MIPLEHSEQDRDPLGLEALNKEIAMKIGCGCSMGMVGILGILVSIIVYETIKMWAFYK